MSIQISASFALPHPLEATLVRGDGAGQTGQTVVVEIRDVTTTNSYLDFADLTFKTAGWTTKAATLTEVGGGHYSLAGGADPFLWTPRPNPPAYFRAEFRVTGPKSGVGADEILITDALPGEEFERDLDITGADTLGWQEVQTNKVGREIRRFNLFDAAGARITGAASSFSGIITRREFL